MHLDLPTLTAMGSFVSACAGMIILIAWSQNRKIKALAIWGLANIVNALGILCLMLGPALRQPVWSTSAAILLVLAPGLMWKAARTFDARPAPLLFALLGAVIVALVSGFPATRDIAGLLSLATSVVYLLAA